MFAEVRMDILFEGDAFVVATLGKKTIFDALS